MGDGSKANKNGRKLEDEFELILNRFNVKYEKQSKYLGLYNKTAKMDFYLTDYDCAIEIKNQSGAGSVWEKIPHVMLSLEHYPAKNGVLFCGDIDSICESRDSWWEKGGVGAVSWAQKFSEKLSKNIKVFHFKEAERFIKNLTGENK